MISYYPIYIIYFAQALKIVLDREKFNEIFRHKKNYIIFTLMLFFVIGASLLRLDSSIAWAIQGKEMPVAKKGVLDLKNWDFAVDGIVNLSGQWKFFWLTHVPPDTFGQGINLAPENFIDVPGSWNGYQKYSRKEADKFIFSLGQYHFHGYLSSIVVCVSY